MKRRELLAGAGLATAAGALWALIPRGLAVAGPSATTPVPAADPLLERLCDIVIPDTDTPGARSAGVPQFMLLALEHGLAGASMADHRALAQRLDREAGGSFLALDAVRQEEMVARIDAAAYAGDGDPAWRRIKALVLMGYYTSEAGATRELQYELVPARFDADVPVKPGDRAWSSDWVGQVF